MPSFPDDLSQRQTAFFLDFDGTLAEIVDDPAAASLAPPTLAALERLREAAGGAVAIVSGRSIAQLDDLLRPLRLPLAGVHGLERRDAAGRLTRIPVDADLLERISALVHAFVEARPGLLAELKPGSIALHYRKRPERAAECLAFARRIAAEEPGVDLQAGKMVIEMKLASRGKGDAIADFMTEAPFRGRRPFFAGDDVTDEGGFGVVNRMGGVSLKVGDGETNALFRIENTTAFVDWLKRFASLPRATRSMAEER